MTSQGSEPRPRDGGEGGYPSEFGDLRLAVDLLAREPASCGRAGAGYVGLTGWVYDADHRPLGHVDAQGVVRRGPQPLARVEGDRVVCLERPESGHLLGTIRSVVQSEVELAYLCTAEGIVQAFLLVDRASCPLEHDRLLLLAGAAIALLGPRLDD